MPGVVERDVHRPVGVHRGADHRFDLLPPKSRPPRRTRSPRPPPRPAAPAVGVDVGAHDLGALGRESPGGGQADPAARSGDDADLAGETIATWGRSLLGRDEYVLGLGERERCVRAELAPEAGRFEAPERRPVPDRGVGVDRQVARLDRPGYPDRACPTSRVQTDPERPKWLSLARRTASASASKAIDCDHRTEYLLLHHAVGRDSRQQNGGREPEAGTVGERLPGRPPARRRERTAATRPGARR